MSTTVQARVDEESETTSQASLWANQVRAIMRLEARKNFLGKRAVLIYLLAGLPVALVAAFAFAMMLYPLSNSEARFFQQSSGMMYAVLYEALVLRTIVFFGCAWIFMNLFRGEVVDKSLHYYFLAPVRREVLVTGKYLAGLLASITLFGLTTLLSYLLLFAPRGSAANIEHFIQGAGSVHALTYVGITVLACLGYGALFLVIGLFFRNPIIPAVIIYGWEFLNFLLPPLLKKISVIHYLQSLSPVLIPEGPFAIIVQPTPAYLSVPGLLILTALTLALASYRIRRMEISYASD